MTSTKRSFWLRPDSDLSPPVLADMTACTSRTERLPVLEGVLFDGKYAVASDSHNMRIVEMPATAFPFTIILTEDLTSKLYEFSFDEVEVVPDRKSNKVHFQFDDDTISVEMSAWVYPKYDSILEGLQKATSFYAIDKADLERAASKEDLDIRLSSENHFLREVPEPDRTPDGAIMSKVGNSEAYVPIEAIHRGTRGFKEEIVFGVGDPKAPIAVWMQKSGLNQEDDLF